MDTLQFNGFDAYDSMETLNGRNLDKDGFVVPAPNGPPKTRKRRSASEEKNYEEASVHLDFKTPTSNMGETENKDGKEGESNSIKQLNEKGAASDGSGTRTVKDVMTKIMDEFINFQKEWSDVFSQSEEFEMNFLQKLDAYIDKAHQRLEQLERQKKALRHGMENIIRILQD